MILADYRCVTCRGRVERLVPAPPPTELLCPVCGDRAQRCYRPIHLAGVARPPSADGHDRRAPSCRDYPDIPGLCHMTPSAARAWVARARGTTARWSTNCSNRRLHYGKTAFPRVSPSVTTTATPMLSTRTAKPPTSNTRKEETTREDDGGAAGDRDLARWRTADGDR